jgi:hypothetical protein
MVTVRLKLVKRKSLFPTTMKRKLRKSQLAMLAQVKALMKAMALILTNKLNPSII